MEQFSRAVVRYNSNYRMKTRHLFGRFISWLASVILTTVAPAANTPAVPRWQPHDFWQHYDRVMTALSDRGIQAHMLMKVYNKQVKWPARGSEEEKLFFRWLVARYAAYPNVIWDFSKEAHNEKDLPYKQGVLKYIRKLDPYHHLMTVHDDDQVNDRGAYDELTDLRADQQHGKWHEVNLKVIPRVYLHWSRDTQKYWPADMKADDYSSEQFKRRVLRLVARLGECWDNDPRVAFIQMGLIGKWGEHHSPDVSPEMQKLLGDAFTRAFPNKKVMVRHPWDFKDYGFGIYWDSFAHPGQMKSHGAGIEKISPAWKTAPIGGEVAYDWGNFKAQLGDKPDDTVTGTRQRGPTL
jgi:hypothetical protein